MKKITNYNVQKYMPNGIHAAMQSCNIIPTHLIFPASQLPSFSQLPSLPPGRRRQKKNTAKIFLDFSSLFL
jgi:hypothetical protein